MTARDCEFVASLCAARAGLRVDPARAYLVESRLGPVARREGFGSVAELLQVVRDRGDERQVWAVVEAMVLPETSFFRDRAGLEQLWRETAPEIARRRNGAPVRIWSAGCASGQEVYSLAMLLEEAGPGALKAELFASDLSERLLEKAQSGLYSQFEVQRGLAARELVRHFEKRDEMFLLSRRVRQHVRWRRVNLIDDFSRLGRFDIVLCRHVLGSLTEPARARVLAGLAGALAPDGVLMLGAGESWDEAPAGLRPVDGLPGAWSFSQAVRAAA
ncbi:chemotaxis protein CheR [Phenylobacterium hankyongense]|uniref:protein-glutamate O-methyltransferase n=1 Tax=Phenylobacterium hankyongense TaxID=1813876 RepID=A0A328AYS4_9CAUL|nr:protein-glutamate O-methyltransferase CheR [Phenylobacterium hankyongense]RAK59789.1 chemotaxis protein CheR [Phenylobacterium hankyongense]